MHIKERARVNDKTARNVVIVDAGSREELLANIETIRKTLNTKVMTRNGIEGPIWR